MADLERVNGVEEGERFANQKIAAAVRLAARRIGFRCFIFLAERLSAPTGAIEKKME